MGAVNDENIDTLRYTAIGNAVSVPVVAWIANKVKKQLDKTCGEEDINKSLSLYPDFSRSAWSDTSLSEIDFSDSTNEYKWQRGGIVWADRIIECNIFPTPSSIINEQLCNS